MSFPLHRFIKPLPHTCAQGAIISDPRLPRLRVRGCGSRPIIVPRALPRRSPTLLTSLNRITSSPSTPLLCPEHITDDSLQRNWKAPDSLAVKRERLRELPIFLPAAAQPSALPPHKDHAATAPRSPSPPSPTSTALLPSAPPPHLLRHCMRRFFPRICAAAAGEVARRLTPRSHPHRRGLKRRRASPLRRATPTAPFLRRQLAPPSI